MSLGVVVEAVLYYAIGAVLFYAIGAFVCYGLHRLGVPLKWLRRVLYAGAAAVLVIVGTFLMVFR